MEEQLNPLAMTQLLQHTLRGLCIHEHSQWIYAVFWRILPRNYPPPNWDIQERLYDRSIGNKRNWILVWEDGFCNFADSALKINPNVSSTYGNCEPQQSIGLQPEVFFKMSHEIYNFGEGSIGKVAADHSHKWVSKESSDNEISLLSAWHNQPDSHPRAWEAQFQSGIQTIALIAVKEGVVQLGSLNKVTEDLSYVVLLRKKFDYLHSIPGVLLPHPSSSSFPSVTPLGFHDLSSQQVNMTPSPSSLEALLSKLPSVDSLPTMSLQRDYNPMFSAPHRPMDFMMDMGRMAKVEVDEDGFVGHDGDMNSIGESSSTMSYHFLTNVAKSNNGF
ncbi:hypothetical protein QJS10_CPA09g00496 [Acorus calamus]|uniref:Transcription factor MYC/MYB N-terminal domain-containing protein n=1 Tax=Acorus calamus TaxID=4465 RepID=A0AAV9E5R2_ACOCL|nr:hypothetical protein QJS10_CPA09g00496 [Acorus calamus]